jgi:hypothetical protein
MNKVFYLFAVSIPLIFLQTVMLFAQDTCCVSGEVHLTGDKAVYIYLLDSEGFREFKKKLPSQPFEYVIQPDQARQKREEPPLCSKISPRAIM